jgi:hypothetical protein
VLCEVEEMLRPMCKRAREVISKLHPDATIIHSRARLLPSRNVLFSSEHDRPQVPRESEAPS